MDKMIDDIALALIDMVGKWIPAVYRDAIGIRCCVMPIMERDAKGSFTRYYVMCRDIYSTNKAWQKGYLGHCDLRYVACDVNRKYSNSKYVAFLGYGEHL